MKQFKRLGLLLASMFALAAFVPAVASAGEGTIEIDQDGTPCPITYTYNGSLPGSGTVSNITSNGCNYEGIPIQIINGAQTNVTATFTAGGTATLTGNIHARILGFLNCYYQIDPPGIIGTWSAGPPATFSASGGSASLRPSPPAPASSGLCPNPLSPITIQGTLP